MTEMWILEEIATWREKAREIQKEFMREGVYTHLYISEITRRADQTYNLFWFFIFADLGMHHEIQKSVCFGQGRQVTIDDESFAPSTPQELRRVVFDHYRPFLEEIEQQQEILYGAVF